MKTPQQIVDLLASERKKRGLPFTHIAKDIDFTYQSIASMESGKNALSIDMLLALADYYALKIDVIPKE